VFFVIVKKNKQAVPSDQQLTKAMTESGGDVYSVTASDGGRKVQFSGTVTRPNFVNNLRAVANGKADSWEFVWADANLGRDRLGATQYEVDITMTKATIDALHGGNYRLYGFKAVQTNQGGGAPVVWFQLPSPRYSTSTAIVWNVQYQAYTSEDTIVSGGKVTATFAADIDLGQTLDVEADGTGPVTDGGPAQAISILNTSGEEFTCGTSQQLADGSYSPMCAFPLYGHQLDAIAPIEKILLMFSTEPANTGTVVEQAYTNSILIDLTSANLREVYFDINQGWSWGGYNWASSYLPNENLVPLLIESPASDYSKALVKAAALVLR
jgi:hypothetical protein